MVKSQITDDVAKAKARRAVTSGSPPLRGIKGDKLHILTWPDYFDRQDLRNAYTEFISNLCNWDWFCTMTWKSLVHPESALKLFYMFVHRLNRQIHGSRYYKRKNTGVFCCIALEMQFRQVLHIHSLISGIPSHILYTENAQWWQRKAGSCDIQPYDYNRDAGRYLSKYVAKNAEIEFYGNASMVSNYEVPELLFR